MKKLALCLVLVTACGGEVAVTTSLATSTTSPTTTPAPTTTTFATTTTTASTTTTAPTTTTTSLDPDILFEAWKSVFVSNYMPLFTDGFPAAVETDFYWVDSVDRVTYDPETHHLTVDATISFEGVYERDPQEWKDDTWTFYRDFGHTIWNSLVEGFEREITEGDVIEPDWPRWTPGLRINGNTGRLTAECPGSLISGIQNRQSTQVEFESECSFET